MIVVRSPVPSLLSFLRQAERDAQDDRRQEGDEA